MSQKQAVKVVIRTRPTADFASKNVEIDSTSGCITLKQDKDEKFGLVNNQTDIWKFKFEQILHNATQDETYETSASEIVQSVVEGYNGTVLCYGQTGAGKTYSMTGSSTVFKYRGLVPRAVTQLYALTQNKFDQAITIRVSYAEIYNEKIRDLLPNSSNDGIGVEQNLQITDDQRGGVAIKGLTQIVCDTEEEALNCLFEGELNRTIRQHNLNAASSRAHTIFTLHVESRSRVESADKVVFSKLHLVDLAGSEMTKKTGSDGIVLKESCFINKSLSFLEQVVLALSSKKRGHIPYRQAKLTNFLRDSIGGNCKTVMIANIWPEARHLSETASTLKFASRMMKITNEATVNTMMDPALQIKRLEKEIRDLKQELAMHDTLSNRGRINYASYNQTKQAEIQDITSAFLSGEREDIGDIDSLRKVREVFSCIKMQYRKTQQNIEAIKRQVEANPDAFKQMQEEQKRVASSQSVQRDLSAAAEESKDPAANADGKSSGEIAGEDAENAEMRSEQLEEAVKQKREAIDKQQAFIEFKACEEGQAFESRIRDRRNEIKEKRASIKNVTETLNGNKQDIDALKGKLDRKEEERKVRMRDEQLRSEDIFEERAEEIIDEEELVMLRKMKDLKKIYRDNFAVLKSHKNEYAEGQKQIDVIKEQLINAFEEWYATEFDLAGAGGLDNAFNQNLQNEMQVTKAESFFGGSNQEDEDHTTFMRAKKKVEVLARAKKLEKSIGVPRR